MVVETRKASWPPPVPVIARLKLRALPRDPPFEADRDPGIG